MTVRAPGRDNENNCGKDAKDFFHEKITKNQ